MHEAGLARSVARVLRERRLRPDDVRLAVRGGHHDPDEFAQELRAHLAAEFPDDAAAIETLEIRRVPIDHLCLGCGHIFESAAIDPACPRCDGSCLPAIGDEQIDVERILVAR